MDVGSLVKETGRYKANIYDAAERLCEKGLISKIIENNKRIYQIQSPHNLIEFIQKKKEDLEEQEKLAISLSKQVQLSKKQIHYIETAAVFRGIAGVKHIYADIIENKLDYLVFGSPQESEKIVQEYYWKNLHTKQRAFNIKSRMIFHKSLRHWKKIIPVDIIKLKFLDHDFEPLTETTIYGNKVSFVVWIEKPIVTIIDNGHVAATFRQIFEIMWKQAKK